MEGERGEGRDLVIIQFCHSLSRSCSGSLLPQLEIHAVAFLNGLQPQRWYHDITRFWLYTCIRVSLPGAPLLSSPSPSFHLDGFRLYYSHLRQRVLQIKKKIFFFEVQLFPRWFSGKESACNTGDTGSIPGWGRPQKRKWKPTLLQYFLPEKCHGQRSLAGSIGLQTSRT